VSAVVADDVALTLETWESHLSFAAPAMGLENVTEPAESNQ
jgi:hypothetical protein